MFNNSSWLANISVANRVKNTYLQGFLDICGNIVLRNGGISLPNGDVSMNGNLWVGLDASFNQNVSIKGITTFNDDIYQIDGNNNMSIVSSVGTFPNYKITATGPDLICIGNSNFDLVSNQLRTSIAIGTDIIEGSNPIGHSNVGIGKNVFRNLLTGTQNTGMGNNIAISMTAGDNNVFIGNGVATSTTSTGNTVALGAGSGGSNITGLNNTYIGAFTGANAGTYNNSTAIGYGANITSSYQIKLGTRDENVNIDGNIVISKEIRQFL